MAVTPDTLRLLDGMRLSVHGPVDAAAAALITAWASAWNEVAAEWDAALAELVAGGVWPSQRKVLRAERAKRALEVTRDRLHALSADLPVRVAQAVPTLTSEAEAWTARVVASQLPSTTTAAAGVTFNRVDPRALDAIVRRTTHRVESAARPLPRLAEQAMKRELVRGITVGDNPRRSARLMVDRVHGAFDGGRNRALVIARTEMLDAHRAAARATDRANEDVLAGWQWVSSLDRRTCPSCWSKHGTTYPLDVDGPHDHQQGRCTGLPVTKSWADLGFEGVDEPPSVLVDAEARFKGLSDADQVAVMGRARLDLLKSGRVSWGDLSRRRSTDGWRDSFVPTPVRDLAV